MDSAPPASISRLSIGWLMLWAFVSAELVLAGHGFQQSSGTRDTAREFALISMVAGSLVLLPIVFVWFGLWALIFTAQTPGWGRVWVLLLPQIAAGTIVAFDFCADPPSPRAFFVRKFGVPLPVEAHLFRVKGQFANDNGNFGLRFVCTPEGTKQLIDRLHLRTVPRNNVPVRDMVESLAIVNNLPHQEIGGDFQAFIRRDGQSGVGYFLICDKEMTQVMVARDELAFKTDADGGVDPLASN